MAKFKIKVIQHLLKGNKIAKSGDIVDASEFIDLENSLKGGYCEEVDPKDLEVDREEVTGEEVTGGEPEGGEPEGGEPEGGEPEGGEPEGGEPEGGEPEGGEPEGGEPEGGEPEGGEPEGGEPEGGEPEGGEPEGGDLDPADKTDLENMKYAELLTYANDNLLELSTADKKSKASLREAIKNKM